jgi:uncharacterized protein (TIGR02453 family)
VSEFRGFAREVQAWFRGLEADNSKEYFAARRDFYEESIRDQMEALLDELRDEFGGEIKMFRQNRDMRFSPDKSPYKTNTYGILYGTAIAAQGLYASISADGLVAGSGYHVMAPDQLDRYRASVHNSKLGGELAHLLDGAQRAGLEVWGESLATAPRGFPKDHDRIELLRRKNLTLGRTQKFGRGISRAAGPQFVAKTWRAGAPVTGWLDRHVGASTLPAESRRRPR